MAPMKQTSLPKNASRKTPRLFSALALLVIFALAAAGALHLAAGKPVGPGYNSLSLHENLGEEAHTPRSGASVAPSRRGSEGGAGGYASGGNDEFYPGNPSLSDWTRLIPGAADNRAGAYRERPEDGPNRTNSAAGRGRSPRVYTVAEGDSWVIIAKRTLGDGSRWKELIEANPEARDGLVVGSRLIIPN